MLLAALPLPGTLPVLCLLAALWVAFFSCVAYGAFRDDKDRAVARKWRIPEGTLLALAMVGGWPGAKLAQRRLNHKTRKQPFARRLNRIGTVQAVAILLGALLVAMPQFGLSPPTLWMTEARLAMPPKGGAGQDRAMPRRFGPGGDETRIVRQRPPPLR